MKTIKTTGYLRGLYTEDEFNFENVNSNKETKMAFLDKLIEVIGLLGLFRFLFQTFSLLRNVL